MNIKQISSRRATVIGVLWVNIPVLPILFSPIFIFSLFNKELFSNGNTEASAAELISMLALLVLGFALSWLWWSVNVPRWRLWAFRRVDNIELLKQKAVAAGITWPDGHMFEKTEIKTEKNETD